ncbi:hypothetical protein B0H15DRAFT_1027784 [Mycena belliarum]|uniref:NTF2 domain-containing protein n=1 Tax=Mycena belliarum TaxID=1033014 RepID=A0AAD6TRI8_9AGAR|nr:hypothetical protein B0H15DRAFT_1027784 [Mycena belliae]
MSLARNRHPPSVKPTAPIAHAEDSQPNESIDKRRAVPSLVLPSKSQPRSDYRHGFQGKNRGRGGIPNARGGHRNMSLGQASPAPGSDSTLPSRRVKGHPIPFPMPAQSAPVPQSAPMRQGYPIQMTKSSATRDYAAQPPAAPSFRSAPISRRQDAPRRDYHTQPSAQPRVGPSFTVTPRTENTQTRVHSIQTVVPPRAGPSLIPRTENARTARPIPKLIQAVVTLPHPQQTILQAVPRDVNSPPPPKRRRVHEPAIKREEPAVTILPAAQSHAPNSNYPPPLTQPRAHEPNVKLEESVETIPPVNQPHAQTPTLPGPPLPPAHIKLEIRTPSPPLANPPRRAITAGSKRYFPVPSDCVRALNPDFIANRRAWARRECAVLRDLGLHIDKFFFRDDGMVIEWTSPEPVWLDTLRPVRSRPRPRPSAAHEVEIIDVDAEPPPPDALQPSSPRHASPIALQPPEGGDGVTEIAISSAQVEQLTAEEEQVQLEQLSLDFIQQYILTFDRDRAALAPAYAEDAIVSFRDTNFARPSKFTFQRAASSTSKRTMPSLPALAGLRFSPAGGTIALDYDTVVLESGQEVLLSVYTQLTGPATPTLALDQSFVLRRSAADPEWPLVAISHVMVVRETPWVRWTGTLEGLCRKDG